MLTAVPPSGRKTAPVFLPPHELLTLYPGLVAVYDGHYLEFDEIQRDTCVLLGQPLPRDSRTRLLELERRDEALREELTVGVRLQAGRLALRLGGGKRRSLVWRSFFLRARSGREMSICRYRLPTHVSKGLCGNSSITCLPGANA